MKVEIKSKYGTTWNVCMKKWFFNVWKKCKESAIDIICKKTSIIELWGCSTSCLTDYFGEWPRERKSSNEGRHLFDPLSNMSYYKKANLVSVLHVRLQEVGKNLLVATKSMAPAGVILKCLKFVIKFSLLKLIVRQAFLLIW